MQTRVVDVGGVKVGGNNKITVQSMTNTATKDISSTIKQILELEKAGCEIVRCGVPDEESALALREIKKAIHIPLVADIHFDYKLALLSLDNGADKIRINPGNMRKIDFIEVIKKVKDLNKSIRIGINTGSLGVAAIEENLDRKAKIMVDKAEEYINQCLEYDFNNIVVSLKASDVDLTILSSRMFRERLDYPLHVGVTESGPIFSGLIKSSIGLGLLLKEGIGETIRVSLTSDPVWEVRAGFYILQALGLRFKYPEIVSCPTCARTTVDVITLVAETEKLLYAVDWSNGRECAIKIAVMGCVVNGPGEARHTDFGICGAGDKVVLFREGKEVERFDPSELEEIFLRELRRYLK